MNTLRLSADSAADVSRAAALIREGALVAFPTETVYGLGADATDDRAVLSIYLAKGRESDNPLIVHFASPDEIGAYAKIPDQKRFALLAKAFMPGPLTVVLPRGDALSPCVSAGLSTVAVRCPENECARALIAQSGVPIAAPSANRSHCPSPTCAAHVLADLDGRIAAVLDGGDCRFGVESTVLALSEPLRILRPGAVTREMLSEACGCEVLVEETAADTNGAVPSPGMKYRHYAPRAPMTALVGADEAVRACFEEALSEGCGVLCWEEDLSFLPESAHILSLGRKDDPAQQARRLYRHLRALDDMALTRIYTRIPAPEGMGLAVYNRLLRACEFRIKEV